jgi:hypothetical protein
VRAIQHCRAVATETGDESEAHFTFSVPPWFWALQVPVQVTVQVAPDAQLTLDPAPTVTVQSLPARHCTLAEAPAVREHVAWLSQPRFALSEAVMVQSVPEVHCVSHDDPQAPVHDAPPEQVNEHPLVAEVHAPLPLRLQAPAALQVQLVPAQAAGAPEPDPELDPQAPSRPRMKKGAKKRVIKGLLSLLINAMK